MDIQVKVNVLVNSENRVKAMASVTFDNVFVQHSFILISPSTISAKKRRRPLRPPQLCNVLILLSIS